MTEPYWDVGRPMDKEERQQWINECGRRVVNYLLVEAEGREVSQQDREFLMAMVAMRLVKGVATNTPFKEEFGEWLCENSARALADGIEFAEEVGQGETLQ